MILPVIPLTKYAYIYGYLTNLKGACMVISALAWYDIADS